MCPNSSPLNHILIISPYSRSFVSLRTIRVGISVFTLILKVTPISPVGLKISPAQSLIVLFSFFSWHVISWSFAAFLGEPSVHIKMWLERGRSGPCSACRLSLICSWTCHAGFSLFPEWRCVLVITLENCFLSKGVTWIKSKKRICLFLFTITTSYGSCAYINNLHFAYTYIYVYIWL